MRNTGSYIGRISSGKEVFIGSASPNRHVLITGISGSGKSVRIADIEYHIVNNGGTVIAFDIDGTHEKIDAEACQQISVKRDGLDVKLLDTTAPDGSKEATAVIVQSVVKMICPHQMRGACQLAAVRKAVGYAIRNREKFESDIEAIADGLKAQEEPAAAGAYNHLYEILETGIFRPSKKGIQFGRINVISLKGLDSRTQKRVIEIVLEVLWKQVRAEEGSKKHLTLVFDEFQNLDFHQDSVLSQLLTESRKYGINLILATQTLSIFNKKEAAIINQAAIKLFFQPSTPDVKMVADLIDAENKEKWSATLPRLRIGQAVTVGALEIGERLINQPIITYSEYLEPENSLRAINNVVTYEKLSKKASDKKIKEECEC